MGDGLNIKIWGDNWLPRDNYGKMLSPISIGAYRSLIVRSFMVESNHVR